MISNSLASRPSQLDSSPATWQRVMKEAVRDADELWRLLDLPADYVAQAHRAVDSFPLFVTLPFLVRMRCGNPQDRLLRQVLPLEAERIAAPGFTADPVGDQAA